VANQKYYARKKAELISDGKIYIPNDIKLPYPLERSTAGPGAGSLSIAFSFNNKNIKLEVSKNKNESYSLQKNNTYYITKGERNFLENVQIIPTAFHAPGQAFINLENRCIYNCAFCSVSKHRFLQDYDEDKFVDLIIKASKRSDFSAVSLTSGVYPNNTRIIKMMCEIIQKVKEKLPDIPVGVEPCISKRGEILFLKKAGADEIKINLQIPDKDLFEKICPDFDYDDIMNMLEAAVGIFGRGKVTSNIIFGLGESDEAVLKTIETLASKGVVPTLRKIRINKENKKKLEDAVSYKIPDTSSERILQLANEQKKILKKHNLTTKTFKTMCHPCGCCDIVSFWDV
jgi:biotin synthase-related radical SAM superfamily protein